MVINAHGGFTKNSSNQITATIDLAQEEKSTLKIISKSINQLNSKNIKVTSCYTYACHSGAITDEMAKLGNLHEMFSDELAIFTGAGTKYRTWGDKPFDRQLEQYSKNSVKNLDDMYALFGKSSLYNPETNTLGILIPATDKISGKKIGKLKYFSFKVTAPKRENDIKNLGNYFTSSLGYYNPKDTNKEYQNHHIQLKHGDKNDPDLQAAVNKIFQARSAELQRINKENGLKQHRLKYIEEAIEVTIPRLKPKRLKSYSEEYTKLYKELNTRKLSLSYNFIYTDFEGIEKSKKNMVETLELVYKFKNSINLDATLDYQQTQDMLASFLTCKMGYKPILRVKKFVMNLFVKLYIENYNNFMKTTKINANNAEEDDEDETLELSDSEIKEIFMYAVQVITSHYHIELEDIILKDLSINDLNIMEEMFEYLALNLNIDSTSGNLIDQDSVLIDNMDDARCFFSALDDNVKLPVTLNSVNFDTFCT
ncbi:MAG: hypothetical protein HRU35_04275 [Rickettsiaceae bacterium]|nr:hypothetical protein [Rickettsiaceae bacterium]